MVRLTLVVMFAALLSGCASQSIQSQFLPVEAPDVTVYYMQGWMVQQQNGDQYQVELAVKEGKQPWDEIVALVSVTNYSGQPVNVGPENVSLTQDNQPVKLWTYAELEKKHIDRANSRRTALALGAMAQSLNASQPTTTSTYGTASSYGPGGTANYSGSSYTSTYDPSANAAAQAQIQSNARVGVANIQSDLQQDLNSLSGYLQRTTIWPGKSVLGRVRSHSTTFNQAPESIYSFRVELPSEAFKFDFVEETQIETTNRKLF